MGKVLGFKEDYLYWSIVKKLSVQYHYRMVTISDNHQEIWLETDKDKVFPVVRIIRHDLDWANWLKRDIERATLIGEQIRKKLVKKPLDVLNIYISAFEPVDDYEFIDKKRTANKTTVTSQIVSTASYSARINELDTMFTKSLFIELSPDEEIDEQKINKIKQEALAGSVQQAKEEQQLFQRGKPLFTYFFMAIQLIIFLLMEMNGGSTDTKTLVDYGAKYSPYIMSGEWWRFFTPIVVHIGFMHLLMNTMSLYFIGTEVERLYGNIRFLIIYLVAGFGGSLASLIITPSLSAGASGAIFGCFGALLYFGIIYPKLFFRTMGMNIIILIAVNLGYGFSVSGIDNAGHIGGLIGGFLAAGIVHLPKHRLNIKQLLFAGATIILTYGLLQYAYSDRNQSIYFDETTASLAQEYMTAGETDKASDLLKASIDKMENHPWSSFVLGNIEFERGNYQDASINYEESVKQKPEFHEAYYYLGLCYYKLNRMEEAKKQIQKAVDLSPNQEEYQKILNLLNEAP
ncbi:rhomboid family protein [Bacillus cihuensis]|uniref:rhomboid family protein n=1 Tax=Bacillus cihuensis TaxID=1208599 RepID=UPI0004140C6B|nr:rhomboid family intramembrane serine protease [Bacillus cihuensis]